MSFWPVSLCTKSGRAKRRHDKIVAGYYEYAIDFGDRLSYAYLGEPIWRGIGVREQYHILDAHEEAYASLGYRVIPVDCWIELGGYAKTIDDIWLAERDEGERPVFTKTTLEIPEFPIVSPMIALLENNPGKCVRGFRNDEGDLEFYVSD